MCMTHVYTRNNLSNAFLSFMCIHYNHHPPLVQIPPHCTLNTRNDNVSVFRLYPDTYNTWNLRRRELRTWKT